MKMNLPGCPGKGSTWVPCEWKVVSLSATERLTQGFPRDSQFPRGSLQQTI